MEAFYCTDRLNRARGSSSGCTICNDD